MARFTPPGWTMSPEGTKRYMTSMARIDGIVNKRARKYNLPALDHDDLVQEGRLAAAYAVDNYDASRGSLDGYVSRVVDNALAMVAGEALALCRHPYAYVRDGDTWERKPVRNAELDDSCDSADDSPRADSMIMEREEAVEHGLKKERIYAQLDAMPLGDDARQLLSLRLMPPVELWITARNLSGRMRIDIAAYVAFLGWPRVRVRKALSELDYIVAVEMGIGPGRRTAIATTSCTSDCSPPIAMMTTSRTKVWPEDVSR